MTLMESDTAVLLSIRGNSISNAYEKVNEVLERNNRYKKLLQVLCTVFVFHPSISASVLVDHRQFSVLLAVQTRERQLLQFKCSNNGRISEM